jgi:predicted glycosyltransferase
MSSNACRALFYSHDTLGLGHLRRTLLLCAGLGERFQDLSILVLTGSAMAHAFRIPPGLDYVKLPSVTKLDNERYESRFLGLPFEQTLALREHIILQTTIDFRPDFFFVDNVPLGMKGEVRGALEYIRSRMPESRVFLGLRDILDDSAEIVPLWRRMGVFEAIDRLYDCVFIYGLAEVFDPVREYQWPESLRAKTCFCGYIPRPVEREASRAARRELCAPGEKLVLVTVGGGSDGACLVENYLRAVPEVSCHTPVTSLVLLGPEMRPEEARRLGSIAAGVPAVRFREFCEDPLPLMDAADLVVSMAGYNTISEILALRKKAIVVPRIRPRTEQLLRSRRLQDLGLLRMIHPDELTPRRLAGEMVASLRARQEPPPSNLDFGAIERLSSRIGQFLQAGVSTCRE